MRLKNPFRALFVRLIPWTASFYSSLSLRKSFFFPVCLATTIIIIIMSAIFVISITVVVSSYHATPLRNIIPARHY